MRVLTTDAGQEAGYSVVRCLRAHADFLAVGCYGGRRQDISRSRYVDDVLALVLPKAIGQDALELGEACSGPEQTWCDTVLDYCRRRRIDAVVPTTDAEVYALAKAGPRFEASGVFVPLPVFDVVRRLLDKLDAPVALRDAGLPVPAFKKVTEPAQAHAFAREVGYPVVVKERFGYFSRGVRLVLDERALNQAVGSALKSWRSATVQEYVPGSREPSLMIALSSDARAQEVYVVRKLRYVQSSFSTCIKTAPPIAELDAYVAFAEAQGLPGIFVVQLKEDARDGAHRLMEVNLRLGANARILTRLGHDYGFNAVLASLRPAPADSCGPRAFPAGCVGVSPVEDVMAVATYLRARRARRAPRDNPIPSYGAMLSSYAQTYVCARPTVDWFAASLLTDTRATVGSFVRNAAVLAAAGPDFIAWGEVN
jgi:biotin carboxylase